MERSFHIEFDDGSNPYYHFPCEDEQHIKELRRWMVHFDLILVKIEKGIEYYRARRKGQMDDRDIEIQNLRREKEFWIKEAALWKGRAIESAQEACNLCDYQYGKPECMGCRVRRIRETE